jgi:hypothetical protein
MQAELSHTYYILAKHALRQAGTHHSSDITMPTLNTHLAKRSWMGDAVLLCSLVCLPSPLSDCTLFSPSSADSRRCCSAARTSRWKMAAIETDFSPGKETKGNGRGVSGNHRWHAPDCEMRHEWEKPGNRCEEKTRIIGKQCYKDKLAMCVLIVAYLLQLTSFTFERSDVYR